MKKLGIITLCAVCTFLFASCGKDYKTFVGTWGVEKIEYYNIDYAGNPIAATIVTHNYDPDTQVLTIYNTSWIISMFSDATSADMDIEEITDNSIVASWINHFSEPEPFFERFFLKRID